MASGTIRMTWIVAFLLRVFGKLGVTLLMGAVGSGVLIAAAVDFRKRRSIA
jgi:hypothetical protein